MSNKKTEALKLALEALENHPGNYKLSKAECAEYSAVEDAIREALAEQPAQVDPCIDGSCSCCWTHLDDQPAQQQEPVAWTVDMLERIDAAIQRITSGQGCMRVPPDKTDPDLVLAEIRKLIKSSPQPSKPWVGLTEHDMDVLFLNEDGVRFARYIEAKLKEKNT